MIISLVVEGVESESNLKLFKRIFEDAQSPTHNKRHLDKLKYTSTNMKQNVRGHQSQSRKMDASLSPHGCNFSNVTTSFHPVHPISIYLQTSFYPASIQLLSSFHTPTSSALTNHKKIGKHEGLVKTNFWQHPPSPQRCIYSIELSIFFN